MEAYPIELTYHVRNYSFGERLIPELLGKEDAPEGKVSETWEISDYRETTGTVANGPYAGRTLHELVEEFPDELVGRGLARAAFPAPHKVPRRLPHAPCTPARRRRDREREARRAARQDRGLAHPLGRRRRHHPGRHQGGPLARGTHRGLQGAGLRRRHAAARHTPRGTPYTCLAASFTPSGRTP